MDPLGVGEIDQLHWSRLRHDQQVLQQRLRILALSLHVPQANLRFPVEQSRDEQSLSSHFYFMPSLLPIRSYTVLASRRRPITCFFSSVEFQSGYASVISMVRSIHALK